MCCFRRLTGVLPQLNTAIGGDDDSEGEDANSPYSILQQWLIENRDSTSAVEVYKKIQELGIEKKHKTVLTCARHLFTEDIVDEIESFGPLFKKVCFSHNVVPGCSYL